MKVFGKNVVVGTKKICTEFTSKINGCLDDCQVSSVEYKGEDLENNILFIRDKLGYLVELRELGSFPTLSLICYGGTTRWKTSPKTAGDFYISDITPYFSSYDQDTLFDLKQLVSAAKVYNTKEYQITLNN